MGRGTTDFFLQSQKQPHGPPHYTLQSCPWKGNNRFLPTESETAPQTPAPLCSLVRGKGTTDFFLQSQKQPHRPQPHSAVLSSAHRSQDPVLAPGSYAAGGAVGFPGTAWKNFTSSSPQASKVRGLFSQDRRIRRRVLNTVVLVRGLLRRPGAGIMEADDRQMTTVFTVQPSFHHRHSTNRVL